jgi:hypothetical protein
MFAVFHCTTKMKLLLVKLPKTGFCSVIFFNKEEEAAHFLG